ncbi:hypothetical protein Cantr_02445 [Candida viswanathii]|uniref:Uncharacterized protein n=1 Tax=Candida viswanathii TaxID=5486 RepID=A0A367YPU2_9ASCO|nr:hypothetical protein Cantr_02445 [Candida viswanathii]
MTIRDKHVNCSMFVPSLETICLLCIMQRLCNPGGKMGLFNVLASHMSMRLRLSIIRLIGSVVSIKQVKSYTCATANMILQQLNRIHTMLAKSYNLLFQFLISATYSLHVSQFGILVVVACYGSLMLQPLLTKGL